MTDGLVADQPLDLGVGQVGGDHVRRLFADVVVEGAAVLGYDTKENLVGLRMTWDSGFILLHILT